MKKITHNLGEKLQWFLYFVICRFGFHKWGMTKWCRFKDKKCKYLVEEGFDRDCEHPFNYVVIGNDTILNKCTKCGKEF